jgi:hypothetical protein
MNLVLKVGLPRSKMEQTRVGEKKKKKKKNRKKERKKQLHKNHRQGSRKDIRVE